MTTEPRHNGEAVRRIGRLTCLQQFVANAIPIFPAYAIMFNDRGGLSTSQISILFIILNVSSMAAEVPSGILADRIPRRTVLLLSAMLTGLAFAFWLALPSFLGYALGFVVWGVGFAMSSGALQAYLYDELTTLQRTDAFTRIFSRSRSASFAGMFVGYVIAIIVGIEHYEWLLVLSLMSCAGCAAISLRLPRDTVRTSIAEDRGHLRLALSEVRRSPILLRIVLTIALVGGAVAAIEDYVPLYYSAARISIDVIPYLLLVGVTLGVVVTWFAERFAHRPALWLLTMVLLASLILALTSYGSPPVLVLGMLVFMALTRLSVVLFEASMQHASDGSSRATLGSLPTFLLEIWVVVLAAIYGVVAYLSDDFAAIRALALVVAATAIALLVWWRRLTIDEAAAHSS